MLTHILPLADPDARLENAGGKGANLARLVRAGFPVPGGFIITTAAYRAFVDSAGLSAVIDPLLAGLPADQPAALEAASQTIRAAFRAAPVPPELAAEITAAYAQLGCPPVAVRSSATSEDLPDLSFAGQQDTYLNITGETALLRAVVDCWGSLWTARAIGYRARNHIPPQALALAVVVQQMVQSESSGVLFTANPLSGLRSQVVIDAAFGLGEALVSGQVEPDHYVVDGAQISARQLGSKAVAIHGDQGGGVSLRPQQAAQLQALPDAQILALAELSRQVEQSFGAPQDIEWAWAEEKLVLLQSRPVTSLFPLPEGVSSDPLMVFFSFGSVQGMLDPITPIGRDLMKTIFAAMATMFGYHYTAQTQRVLYTAGERLWANITAIVTNSVGRSVERVALPLVDPAMAQALMAVWDDPRLLPGRPGISLKSRLRLAGFVIPLVGNVLLNLISPNARRARIVESGEQILREMQAEYARLRLSQPDARLRVAAALDAFEKLLNHRLGRMFIRFVSCVAAGMASLNALNHLAGGEPTPENTLGWRSQVLEVTRGIPYNPTTEMDLALWECARTVKDNPAALRMFQTLSLAELHQRWLAGEMPEEINVFLRTYGGRGLAEIDLGRARWQEDTSHVFSVIQSYLNINPEQAPDRVFARGAQAAQAAVDELAAAVQARPGGWLKARLLRLAASRVRALMGARESPKFFVVRLLNLLRQELLACGRELTAAGVLVEPDDLMYCSFDELVQFSRGDQLPWGERIAAHRAAYQRELRRRQIPRLILSDGRTFYDGLGAASGKDTLTGSPVSPGVTEGTVRVVFSPHAANLQPGDILVCPGTDPSWTPLFLAAGGLVMEVGGMMTHGAVVAREYGIPAVVGVHEATTRLQTGQRIRVDGSTGVIEVLNGD